MKNGVMLITYPDSMGSNLSDLDTILSKHFSKALTSLHILPFFPSSGDRGFAPYTYEEVDPAFGSWKDIDHLAETYDLVFDYMINHISAKSPLLKEYLAEGPDSPSKDYFIDYETFWGGEPT
ncbi:MAG: alpha-amylase family glycosyl hydrolase, partial [Sphaerochaeta sp.]|nr:alpha-amylase family glycosyl hydrolase [Sphaerochaeta sp.]